MSRRSVVIIGLTRQTRLLLLPLPYAMAVGAFTVLPFMWTKLLWWPLTFFIWWCIARVLSLRNPQGAIAFATVFETSFDKSNPLPKSRRKGRTYANG
ncbi:VirB3 family type IV secretion system protein [uncultured Tateyamaria sp.]|uniref:VirB3 family type IV secretion system protein n=1 Tax=uncultured Tateyamaria sp. TaxID=455651 RepID=UPI00344A902F